MRTEQEKRERSLTELNEKDKIPEDRIMERIIELQPLTPEDYSALPLGEVRWTFSEFGGVTLETLKAHCKNGLNLTDFQIGKIEAAHARHPMRLALLLQAPHSK